MGSRVLLGVVAWVVGSAAPASALVAWLARHKPRIRPGAVVLALGLGVACGLVSVLVERAVLRIAGLDEGLAGAGALPLVTAIAFVGPLEEGLKVAAVWPAFRARGLRSVLEAALVTTTAASGLALVRTGFTVAAGGASTMAGTVAMVLEAPAQILFAGTWGYVLGRSQGRTTPRRGFFVAWLVAAIAHGVFARLDAMATTTSLLASAPLLTAFVVLALFARRELTGAVRRTRSGSIAPTSLREVRDALARRDRPASIRAVVVGALVNQGVLFVMLGIAVVVGRRAGVDFAAVEDTNVAAATPLVLLGVAAVVAFAFAGFLVARASESPTLLEPALSAAIAILGLVVLLGLAAPVGIVFALACAPIALLLACAGAWVGIGR